MTPKLRLPSTLKTRLLAALMLVVAAGGGWIGWLRFRAAGASFDSGMVQDFLESRFAGLSGGVYHIQLGSIHFDIEGSGATIDSVVVTTDTVLNKSLAHPLPTLFVVLREAQVRGVVREPDGQRISIDEIRFGGVTVLLTFARADTVPQVVDTLARSLVSWTLQLPPGAPEVFVGRVLLQGMTAEVRPAPGTGGRPQRIEHLSLILDSVRLDRRPEGLDIPVVVHDIRLQASAYQGGWDSASTISVGGMQGSFRDSSLSVHALGLAPARSVAEVLRRGRTRRERYTVSVDSVVARGVDWGAVLRVGAVPARHVVVHGPRVLIHTDKRLAGRPTPRPRTPILQETLTKFGRPVAIDTLRIRGGRLRYEVRPETGTAVGEVDFQRVEGVLTGLLWDPDERRPGVATLQVRGSLWGVAPMALSIRGPRSSRQPAAEVELFVGAMPMTTANAFATSIGKMDIKSGELDSLRVRFTLAGDRCEGEARPYYRDLSVRMISRGGWLSRLGGGARSLVANAFVVRDDNPDGQGVVTAGTIAEVRDPWQAFWPFLWVCSRAGLSKVAAGKGQPVAQE